MSDASASTSATLWARGLKRGADVLAAVALLLVLSPLLLFVAVGIKLTSAGPVFFTQERSGRNGARFRLFKFRTMRGGRTPDPKELVPLDHAEITGLGRVLRRTKIDELPQLLNVLKGEMSLVGPRPTLPDQVEAYDEFRRQRLAVRPGITGLAQVHGNTAISWDQRILFDIAYVRRCRFLLDLGILFRTVGAIISGEPSNPPRFQQTRYAAYVSLPDGFESPPSE